MSISCRTSHAANTSASIQVLLLVPCTNRRYFVLLPVMPLLCNARTMWLKSIKALTFYWQFGCTPTSMSGLNTETAYLLPEKHQNLASQIGLISSLSSTTDLTSHGLRRLEEVWQRQEVSKLIAALAYECTKHFLTWLAYPVLVNMLFSSGMEKNIDFSLIVADTTSESKLD